MEALALYLLKSTLYLSIFYLGYKLLLSKETFFGFNRAILLIGICVSLILPAIQVERNIPLFYDSYSQISATSQTPPPETNQSEYIVEQTEIATISGIAEADHFAYTPMDTPMTESESKTKLSTLEIIAIIYFGGIILYLSSLLLSYIRMKKLINRGQPKSLDGIQYVVTHEDIAPFSWKDTIVIPQKELSNLREILTHEKAHINNRHYLDILLSELILSLHWFNPLAWELKKELKDIHEYQADEEVILSGINAKNYQLLILEKAVGSSSYALANSFNHSKIKKRITMMLKQKSKSWNQLKVLGLILCSGIFVYACSDANARSNSTDKNVDKQEIVEQNQTKQKFTSPIDPNLLSKPIGGIRFVPPVGEKEKEPQRILSATTFDAPVGTPVRNVLAGKVTRIITKIANQDLFKEDVILITHDNNVEIIYGGCIPTVKEGQTVEQGEIIGHIKERYPFTGLELEVLKDRVVVGASKVFDFENQEIKIPLNEIKVSNKDEVMLGMVIYSPDGTSQKFTKPVDAIKSSSPLKTIPIEKEKFTKMGIEVSLAEGTPVYAALPGKVKTTIPKNQSKDYGGAIVISHENNIYTVYGGCSASVKEGQEVKSGDKIGVVSQSAQLEEDKKTEGAPYLFFEVRKANKVIDPHRIFDFDKQEIKMPLNELKISDTDKTSTPFIRFLPPAIKPDKAK